MGGILRTRLWITLLSTKLVSNSVGNGWGLIAMLASVKSSLSFMKII